MLREKLGEGEDKIVYKDPIDPEKKARIVFKRKEGRTGEEMKARYYLQRIAHVLFTGAVPDVHAAGLKPEPFIRVERREVDKDHKRMQKELEILRKHGNKADMFKFGLIENNRETHPRVIDLVSWLDNAGFSVDSAGRNFAFDSNGIVQYLDSQDPWKYRDDGTVTFYFDEELLRSAINKLPDPEKTQALGYLEKLLVLKRKVEKEHKKQ